MRISHLTLITCLTCLINIGCTALNTFPSRAVSGETIALAVGSPINMTRANTTAQFRDINGTLNPLTIKSIFQLYADRASPVYQKGGDTDQLIANSGHEPWVTIVAIDLPTLTPGLGQVEFNTTATYPNIGTHINNWPIALDILPGGPNTAESFEYEFATGLTKAGDLTLLEPLPKAVFGPSYPSPACPCPKYGAIEVKVNMPTNFGAGLNPSFMRVLVDDMTPRTGSGRGENFGLATNGEDLTVILTSPTGELEYYEARFSIVLHTAVTFIGTPNVTSVRYFDINGNEVGGPVAPDYTVAMQ